MNDKTQIAMAFYANAQLQIELIDELKGTGLFNQRLKMLGNQILKENEKLIDGLYAHLEKDAEPYFNKSVDMVETFIDAIKKGHISTLIQLMKEYRDGNISVVDDSKHGKMLKQMKKL